MSVLEVVPREPGSRVLVVGLDEAYFDHAGSYHYDGLVRFSTRSSDHVPSVTGLTEGRPCVYLDLDGPEEYVRAAQALLGERVFKSLTSPGNASAEQALTPRIVPIHVTDADHILGQMFRCAELIPQD